MRQLVAFSAALALWPGLAGCSVYRDATTTWPNADWGWRNIITDSDRGRLREWRDTWDDALAAAKGADGGAIAGDPILFDPDRALDKAMPPVGAYHCRTIKLGSVGTAVPPFTAYPAYDCLIAQTTNGTRFAKADGLQRPAGQLFSDTDARAIFLGTMVLGDERAPLRYGIDRKRDMVGYIERIGESRWRMVFPRPRFESMLDIIELTPAG